jgi:hypothetical protein
VFIERDLIAAHLWREDARQELVEVFRTIPDGATRADVARFLPSGDDTFLSVTKLEREWLVSTPLMFGAQNWIMWVEFDSDAVVALRIRTHDSRDEHPPNAPSDRIFLNKNSPSSNLRICIGRGPLPQLRSGNERGRLR